MRGTPFDPVKAESTPGLIPTYAGNTLSNISGDSPGRAHPHVCGEHCAVPMWESLVMGSSPRMRGTHIINHFTEPVKGLIPTYAGNTQIYRHSCGFVGAHPHVCGEHCVGARVCRGRVGLIPTYAGNTLSVAGCHGPSWAHPHVCGEHSGGGLSRIGLIPTYAGNTRLRGYRPPGTWAHPHVCGEHSPPVMGLMPSWGSSPRMRGTHLLTWGFIPTHQVLELVWSPKPVLTLHDFWAYRRREARLYLLALLHPFRGPSSSFGADGRIISFTPSKSTGSHG